MPKRILGSVVFASVLTLLMFAATLAFLSTGTKAAIPAVASLAQSGVQNAPLGVWEDIAPYPTITVSPTPGSYPMHLKRAAAAAYPPNGKIYQFGGRQGIDGEDITLQWIWEYTPGSPGSWARKTALLDGAAPGARYTANSAAVTLTDTDGVRVYVIGGSSIDSVPTPAVRVYDPNADAVTVLTSDPWPATPARVPGGYAVYNNKLYIFGGFSAIANAGAGGVFTDTWRFDPMAAPGSKWTQLGNLNLGRGYIAGAELDGFVYAVGGDIWDPSQPVTNRLVPVSNVERMDVRVANPTWQTVASLPTARGDLGAWAYDSNTNYEISGRVAVAGGIYPTPASNGYLYSPGSNSWATWPSMVHATRNYGYAQLDGYLYALGGYDYTNNTPNGANFNQRYNATAPAFTSTPTITGTRPTDTRTPTITQTVPTTNTPTRTPTVCSSNYVITTATGTVVAGTADSGNHGDDVTTDVTLPFPFSLYGQSYTSATISSNGNLQFGSAVTAYSNDCLPSAAGFGATIFAHWDDLLTSGTCGAGPCGVYTSVSGSAPNRIFNIEWRASYFSGSGTTNFEIRLYEGNTARFDVQYGTVDDAGNGATVGVQNATGTLFTQYECNTGGLTAGRLLIFTLGTCGSTTVTATATRTSTVTPVGNTNTPTRTSTPGGPTSTATSTGTPGTTGSWVDIAAYPTVTISPTPGSYPLRLKRAAAAAYPPNGKIYQFGGRHGVDGEDITLQWIWEYTPGDPGSWARKNALLDGTQPGARYTANSAAVTLTDSNGVRIYVVGGSSIDSVPTPAVRVYDPTADAVTVLTSDPWPATPARVPGGYAVYNNKLYIFGGFSALGAGAVFTDTWQFDPMAASGSKWTQLGNLNLGRGYIAGAELDGYIYAIGGDIWDPSQPVNNRLVPVNNVERMDVRVANPTWQTVASLPTARGDLGAWAYDSGTNYQITGRIAVAGGVYPTPDATGYLYNPGTNSWGSFPSLLHATRNYGYAQLNGFLYALGGYDYTNNTPNGANFNQRYDATAPIGPTVTSTSTASATGQATSTRTNTAVATSTSTSVVGTGTAVSTITSTPGGPTRTATRTPTACVPHFTDVLPTDYYYAAVNYLYCHGAISGYADGSFRPYNDTTRAQVSKIIVISVGWAINTTGGPHFTDVPTSHPFYTWIETAFSHGIISGYSDNTFRPYNNVTRAQLSKMIVLAVGLPINTTGGPHFTDVPRTDPFYNFIETAYNAGIISGYSNNTFRPNNNATRGQVSVIIYRALLNTAPTATAIATVAATATLTRTPVAVQITGFAFVPPSVTIPSGTTVMWTNLDPAVHTSTSNAATPLWDSGALSQNQSFSYTFNTPGTYSYYCEQHPTMMGSITVTGSAKP